MFRATTILLFFTSLSQSAPLPPMYAATFADTATELFIAKCLNPNIKKGEKTTSGVISEIEIGLVLKGSKQPGKSTLITRPHPMDAGKHYLIAVFHTLPKQPAYQEQSEQCFTEIPETFDLKQLSGKTPAQQALLIFAARQRQVDALILRLQKEKKVLDIAAPK
jgi:hypothetical protein